MLTLLISFRARGPALRGRNRALEQSWNEWTNCIEFKQLQGDKTFFSFFFFFSRRRGSSNKSPSGKVTLSTTSVTHKVCLGR